MFSSPAPFLKKKKKLWPLNDRLCHLCSFIYSLLARLSALLLVRFQAAVMIPLPVKVVIVSDYGIIESKKIHISRSDKQ